MGIPTEKVCYGCAAIYNKVIGINEKYAQNMADKIKQKSSETDVFIADTTIAGKQVFRVYAGKFDEKERADILREELIRMGFGRDILVKRITVND